MIIKEVNAGPKIAYEVVKNKITFGDDELTLNLSKYERDNEIVINVCSDNEMIITSDLSQNFVANIIIPARQYTEGENPHPVPFSMDRVELDLWALVDSEVE